MNNFEEWVEEEVQKAFGGMNETFVRSVVGWFTDQAHAIRNKVLHEAIEALPEERHTPRTAVHPDLRGHHIGHNECLQKVKSSLLKLLTKE